MTQVKQDSQDISVSLGDDGVVIMAIDVPGERMNIIKDTFYKSLHIALDELENNQAAKAAVIISGKENSFIAGADIKIIQTIDSIEQSKMLTRQGHELMNRIAAAKKPIVAAINGICLGGGCELALACHARVLSDDAKTGVGLPEVNLGILPGFGGSQRLPRLIGIMQALDMMLTGRTVYAKKAKRLGFADEVVPNSILLQVAIKTALTLKRNTKKPLSRFLSIKGMQSLLLEQNRFGQKIVCQQARKQILAKTHGNYPAPMKIIDVVEQGLRMSLAKALDNEIDGFAELAVTPESKQLINIYFAHTALKKDSFVKSKSVAPKSIEKVGVLGGGLMGAGIAVVSLDKAGAEVRIKDINDDGIRAAIQHAFNHYQAKLKRRTISTSDAKARLSQFTGTLDYSGFSDADLVIEAVFEDLKLKKQMLQDIEGLGNENMIFASNTSSIPIKNIARGSQRPGNIIGMHYFSPVEKMPLLEIIKHNRTSDTTIVSAVSFGRAQGKTVIVVKDVPGFFVNRILFPYINEAGYLLMEGVAVDKIDKAMVKFGFPVGPFKLLDEVGLAVGAKVQQILQEAYPERMQGTDVVAKMLAADRAGKKNRQGFYDYGNKSRGKQVDVTMYKVLGVNPNTTMSADDIALRCILPLLNEAAYCLDEKVIGCARDGDIGAVFGIGFPAFRGGIYRYIDTLGATEVVKQLQALQKIHGDRFVPAAGLVDLAENKSQYHQ